MWKQSTKTENRSLAIRGADKGAPGVNIYSTGIDGRYVEMHGTSITTPHEVGKEIY